MKAFALLVLLCLPAFAKDKPQYTYQDGTLVSYRTITDGSSCNSSVNTTGDVNANTDSAGLTTGTVNATTHASTTCSDINRTLYTVKSGDNVFVLVPAYSGGTKTGVILTMGWGALFLKDTVLANRLPGTALHLRADGEHYVVKIGKRESMYSAVEAK